MKNLNCQKVQLNYPCKWTYSLIIREDININTITDNILKQRKHKKNLSNKSSKGKFNSYKIELEVYDEKDRNNLTNLFSNHKDVKMVL